MDNSDNFPLFRPLITATAILWASSYVYNAWSEERKLRHIPVIGPTGIFSFWRGAFRYVNHANRMIEEGYKKYRDGVFRVATINGWIILVSGTSKIDDLRKAPEEHVSFQEAVDDILQTKYTIHEKVDSDPYHVQIIRTPLTRNINSCFGDVQDEIIHAFAELLPASDEWSKVPVLGAVMKITARTSNRLFVGVPLSRNEDYINLNTEFTVDVAKSALFINLFPDLFKPLVGRYFTPAEYGLKRGIRHLGPLIQECLDNVEKYGKDYPNKPNDMITWLLDYAEGYQRSIRDVTLRVLAVNVAAIHTTSTAFTQVLFTLASHPEYIQELCEEVEAVAEEEGITKSSLHRLVKCDSFIKESHRLEGPGAISMMRKTVKDFAFSDGTSIPAGFHLAVANAAMHLDEEHYADAGTFNGFRFSDRINEADGFNKYSMVALGLDYVIFGHGRHACPGRFFAVNEIKAFLAHVLMNYDVQLDPESPNLRKRRFGPTFVPDPTATLLIRKRRVGRMEDASYGRSVSPC